jgi:hypothetical protein
MQNQSEQSYEVLPPAKGGYYTVNLEIDGKKLPYVVFAASEFDAARKVKYETGCLVTDRDVEGPYHKYI